MSSSSVGATETFRLPLAPITLAEFELLKKSALFGEEDISSLCVSYDILKDQTEQILDVWYGFVGANDHLLHFFANRANGAPNTDYLQGVRKRFGQWILDTAAANYDQNWLDYQFEIGCRHHRIGENRTDGVAAVEHINYRYLPALIIPVTTTLKPFLMKHGHDREDVEKMYAAWVKSVTLQVILWSYPYCKEGDF